MQGTRPGLPVCLIVFGLLWSCNLIVDSVPRHFDGQSDPSPDRDEPDPGLDDGAPDPDVVTDRTDPIGDPAQDPDLFEIPDVEEDGGPYLSSVRSISAGGDHTCVVVEGSQLLCWGSNQYGQLGDGTVEDRHSPNDVTALASGVASVSAGRNHTCAVRNENDVRCWGDGAYGKLGNGSVDDSSMPVPVSDLRDVSTLALGTDHSCALNEINEIWCWGLNQYGQLGNNTTNDASEPVSVQLASGPTWIAAGANHSCAVLNGDLGCWGHNLHGCLGDGTTEERLTPTQVQDTESLTAIAVTAGDYFTCAIFQGGLVKCWGYNADGQLGDGSNDDRDTPVTVLLLDAGVEQLDAGGSHACAVNGSGGAMCWGGNWEGQLGDGTTQARNQPVNVLMLESGVQAISAGRAHTCALMLSGQVYCWGVNVQGQLGDGTTGELRVYPALVVQ